MRQGRAAEPLLEELALLAALPLEETLPEDTLCELDAGVATLVWWSGR